MWFLLPQGRTESTQEEAGEFACPRCRTDEPYSLRVVRATRGLIDRFLPNGGRVLEVFVDCQRCRQRFPGEVRDRTLFRDREAEAAYLAGLRLITNPAANTEGGPSSGY